MRHTIPVPFNYSSGLFLVFLSTRFPSSIPDAVNSQVLDYEQSGKNILQHKIQTQVGPQTLWSSMRTNSKILFDGLNRINFILGTCIFTSPTRPYFLNINCGHFIDNQAPIYKIIVVKQNFPTVFFLCVCRLRTIEIKKQKWLFPTFKGIRKYNLRNYTLNG